MLYMSSLLHSKFIISSISFVGTFLPIKRLHLLLTKISRVPLEVTLPYLRAASEIKWIEKMPKANELNTCLSISTTRVHTEVIIPPSRADPGWWLIFCVKTGRTDDWLLVNIMKRPSILAALFNAGRPTTAILNSLLLGARFWRDFKNCV